MAGLGERITAETPEGDRRGHEFRYRLAAGFCRPGDVVLDSACGAAYGADLLCASGRVAYIGADRDLSDVPKRPQRQPRAYEQVDLETWEPEFDFDVFVGFETIEHLDDCSAYVRAAKRARRWIVLSCPVVPTVGVNPYHRRDFEPGELPSLFVDDDWGLYQTVAQPSELSEIYVLREAAVKLVASMPVHNELDRYLQRTVEHALTYCDEVRVLDNGSTDGSAEWLETQDRVVVHRLDGPGWAEDGGHEGKVRQALLEHTLAGEPTHVLAIDADELVPRGAEMRAELECEPHRSAWTLRVVEAWSTDPWLIRVDGGWKPRHAPIVYRAGSGGPDWHARTDLRLACPREPIAVAKMFRGAPPHKRRNMEMPFDLVHLGWANPAEREERAARYFEHDGGQFHRSEHLDSILWTDERLQLRGYSMP